MFFEGEKNNKWTNKNKKMANVRNVGRELE